MARRARNLAQFCACNTSARRQVIRSFRHFAGGAQSPGDFTCFFLFHNPIISYILGPVKLGGLNPNSLWAGPPAWELETLSLDLQPPGGVFSLLIFLINFLSFIVLFIWCCECIKDMICFNPVPDPCDWTLVQPVMELF